MPANNSDKTKFDMEEALRCYPPNRGSKRGQQHLHKQRNEAARQTSQASPTAENLKDLDMSASLDKYAPSSKDLELKDYAPPKPAKMRYNYRKNRKHERIDDKIDLHNLFQAEAQQKLCDFFENAQRNGMHKICIIHGKGHRSRVQNEADRPANGKGILQNLVTDFLQERKSFGLILDFYHPSEREGGKGATIALLP